MTTLFQRGVAMLASRLHAAGSLAATYRRGAVVIALASGAVPARPQIGTLDQDTGAVIEWDGDDWLVKIADLVALGDPAKGDRIMVGGRTYEVQPPSGDKCFSRVGGDAYETEFRIHAKQVAA